MHPSAFAALFLGCVFQRNVVAIPSQLSPIIELDKNNAAATSCFPSLEFIMPSSVPSSLNNWWCSTSAEYAFVGFSYEVTACQSLSTLKRDFLDIRKTFKGRYVRLYGACDQTGFYDDIIDAAWDAGIGIHALIWASRKKTDFGAALQFGWDDPNIWKTRRDSLLANLHSNPKAKFVTRALQFGSEPLYDNALSADALTAQVNNAKVNLSSLHIPVTVSEMPYGYQVRASEGSQNVMDAIEIIDGHVLPFFSADASTASRSWPIVEDYLSYFIDNGNNKKIYLSQNGWPSRTSSGVEPNSVAAVADVKNEQNYYKLLDNNCEYFKEVAGGGVGWFAHIYSDNQEPGYGIYGTNGVLKFPFTPQTSC